MNARTKSSLLWGAIGGLSFLVLLQAYHLTGGEPVAIPVGIVAAVAAAVGSALLTYLAEGWLVERRNQSP